MDSSPFIYHPQDIALENLSQDPGAPTPVSGSPPIQSPSPQATTIMLAGATLITFFKNQYARTKEEKQLSLEALAEIIETERAAKKSHLPWLKCARFGNKRSEGDCLRNNANVIVVTGVEGDHDNGRMSFGEACQLAKQSGVKLLLYTTASHSEANQRWRAIAIFSRELDPKQRDCMMNRLAGIFGKNVFAGESWNRSQAYYFGGVAGGAPPQVFITDGACIDTRSDLDATAIGKAGEVSAPSSTYNYSSSSNVVPFEIPGTKPALAYGHQSTLNAAAQAGVERRTPSFERITKECPQVQQSLATGGKDDSGLLWYIGFVRLASFCDDGAHYAHEIGKLHPKYTPADTDARFKRAINDDLGAPLCERFNEYRPGVCTSCRHFGRIKTPLVLGREDDATTVVGAQAGGNRLILKKMTYDPKKIKRTPWLVRGLLLRGKCSLVTGLGGSAKTAFAMYVATALAAGHKKVGPFEVFRHREEGLRVLYIAAEEDDNDLYLLGTAAANILALTPAEQQKSQDNIDIHDACESGWALGKPRPDKREDFAPEDEDLGLAELKIVLDGYRFDLVIIDTAASLFKIRSELDNNALTDMVRRVDRVMKLYAGACLILHHSPKTTRAEAAATRGEMTSSRGGGGLPFATRATYSITSLSPNEAAQFITSGIDPTAIRRLDAARVTSAKEPPAALMELISVQVMTDDGTAESVRAIRFNAQIGAVMDSGGITDVIRNIVMVAIDRGTTDKHGAKVPLSPNGSGGNNTRAAIPVISRAIMSAFPELNDKQARERAADTLKDLQASGYVVVNPDARIPKYKNSNGSLSGSNKREGLECRWDLVPWRKPDSASGGGVAIDAASTEGSN